MCPRTCRNELYCKIKSYLFLDVSFDDLEMYNVTLGVHEASYVHTNNFSHPYSELCLRICQTMN